MSIRGSLVGDGESEVSIVIPHYNNSSFLLDAVRSAIASVSDPAQVIVVDDGSTDRRAPEVLEKVLCLGPRVIRQGNSGVSAARNAGIAWPRLLIFWPLTVTTCWPRVRREQLRMLSSKIRMLRLLWELIEI